MAILDSLFVKLGYEYDESQLEKFNDLVGDSAQLVKKLSLATVGLATAFSILFLKVSQNALAQARFGKAMGISRNTVSAFERASDKLTGSRGTATALLETFNGINNAWKAGVKPSDDYIRGITELGLDFNSFMNQSPDEQILQIAEAFQRSTENVQDMSTHLLGLNGDARNFISTLTRQSIADNMPTDADIERAERLNNLIKDFNNTLRDATLSGGDELFKNLDQILKSIETSLPLITEGIVFAITKFLEFGKFVGESIAKVEILFEKLSGNEKVNKVLDLNQQGGQSVIDFFKGAVGLFSGETGTPIFQSTGQGLTQNNKIEINVTANDTEGVGVAVKGGVEQALQNAARNAEGAEII